MQLSQTTEFVISTTPINSLNLANIFQVALVLFIPILKSNPFKWLLKYTENSTISSTDLEKLQEM